MSVLQKVKFLLTPLQKRSLVILTGLLLIGVLFEMLGLGLMLPALSLMLNPGIIKEYPALQPYLAALGNPTQSVLVFWGMGVLVLFYFLKALFLIYLSWKQSRFSAELSSDLSQELFLGYLRLPYSFHLERNSAHLFHNIRGEIDIFTALSQAMIFLATELSVVSGVFCMLVLIEPIGAITITLFLGLSGYLFHRATRKKLLFWGERRQFHGRLIGQSLLQGLGGVKDAKLMGREDHFLNEFAEHSIANATITTRVNTLSQVPRVYLELLAVTGLAGLIILMVLQNKPLDLLIPTLGIFVAAAFRMIPSVNRIMSSVQSISHTKPVIDVLYSEFQLIRSIKKEDNTDISLDFRKEIKLEGVDFRYSSVTTDTIRDISITIKKGSSVGFIGQSGSGKSTLIDVILGLLTPSNGRVLVDGKDIHENIRNWQDQVGYVPQSIYLTDDTLRRNIAFGLPNDKIDDSAVQSAIYAAQLEKFVDSLPEGLETIVGERGIRLSGGQRQRIGIARALYHNPQVLVLDEATSALDTVTEQGVLEALKAMQGIKTLIIVAHRLSTIEYCDQLYRLKHGRIVLEGVPKEIIEKNVHK